MGSTKHRECAKPLCNITPHCLRVLSTTKCPCEDLRQLGDNPMVLG